MIYRAWPLFCCVIRPYLCVTPCRQWFVQLRICADNYLCSQWFVQTMICAVDYDLCSRGFVQSRICAVDDLSKSFCHLVDYNMSNCCLCRLLIIHCITCAVNYTICDILLSVKNIPRVSPAPKGKNLVSFYVPWLVKTVVGGQYFCPPTFCQGGESKINKG